MRKFIFALFLFVSSLFSSSGQINLTNGSVAHYTFNGNPNDQSGYNNNPITNNAVLTSNRFCESNTAYRFQGYFNRNRMDIFLPMLRSLLMTHSLSVVL